MAVASSFQWGRADILIPTFFFPALEGKIFEWLHSPCAPNREAEQCHRIMMASVIHLKSLSKLEALWGTTSSRQDLTGSAASVAHSLLRLCFMP